MLSCDCAESFIAFGYRRENRCTALACVVRCLECKRPTMGSIGQAGYFWRQLCQRCKDYADGYVRAQVHTQAILVKAIDAIVNRHNSTGPKVLPWPTHTPKEKTHVVVNS